MMNKKIRCFSLQIVLAVFLFIFNTFGLYLYLVISEISEKKDIQTVNQLRNIEIILIGYLKNQINTGPLLDDEYEDDDIIVEYTSELVENTYEISALIKSEKYEYTMNFKIDKENLNVTELIYNK